MSKPVGSEGSGFINFPENTLKQKCSKKREINESTLTSDQIEKLVTPSETPSALLNFEADIELNETMAEIAERVDRLSDQINMEEIIDYEGELSLEEPIEYEHDDEKPNLIFLVANQYKLENIFESIFAEFVEKEVLTDLLSAISEKTDQKFIHMHNYFFVKESEQHLVPKKIKEARQSNPHLENFIAYVVKDEEWEEFKEQIVTFLKHMIAILGERKEGGERKRTAKTSKSTSQAEMRRQREAKKSKKETGGVKTGVDWKLVEGEREAKHKDRLSEEREREIQRNKEFTAKKKLKKFRDTERKEKKREEARLENLVRENQRKELGA